MTEKELAIRLEESSKRILELESRLSRYQAGTLLLDRLSFLQTLIDTIPSPIFYKDADGRYRGCNKAFEKAMGLRKEDIVGKTVYDLAPKELADKYFAMDAELFRNPGVQCYEFSVKYSDGVIHHIIFNKATYTGEGGEAAGLVGVMTDITERKRAEEEKGRIQAQLLQSQKMETIGRLTGGIAHDFNNIMTVIKSFTDLALQEADAQLAGYLEQISAASGRAIGLIRQLLIFSRNKPGEFRVVGLNEAAGDMLKILTRLMGANIRISTDFAPELWNVLADRDNIGQLLMNLVINARDAMARGGNILIKTENVCVGDGECAEVPGASGGKFVRLTVEDDGVGMTPEVLRQVFEPFFTTKEPGKGIGLGLSVVQNIVKEHRGWITVESAPGKGTAFRVHLPAVHEALIPASKEALPADSRGQGERILFIEDERILRRSVALMLSKSGYEVFEAESAAEARGIFEKESGRFSLVFCDIMLNDRTGIELVEELLSLNPSLRVLFTSGYLDVESQWPAIQENKFAYLQKPYELSRLLRVIRECISVSGAGVCAGNKKAVPASRSRSF